ncbi:calcium:proton antiporter [Candidatus Korobacter versatilis]|nr:ionic transporter y4hA [Candidatus Koribacter versatilis]
MSTSKMPWWAMAWPLFGWALLVAGIFLRGNVWLATVEGLAIFAVVFAAVYHAELIAHRVGEPFGTLVLALAVTIIEVALIASMMISSGPEKAQVARDTVFAAVMIVCNGIVGLCLLAGGVRHREQGFQLQGTNAALSVLIALSTLTLVFPNITTTTGVGTFSSAQLVFAAAASLVLYGSFVFVQTVRHRDYFLPAEGSGAEEAHTPPPSNRMTLASSGLLLVSLVAVVALAKSITPAVEKMIENAGAPKSVVGILIAGVVLLPEGLAAVRAARANRIQTSMNLALGSALATIGLTIPATAAVAIALHKPIILGLGRTESVLLGLTLVMSLVTLGTGRTTVLQGIVHLVLLAAFLFLAFVP